MYIFLLFGDHHNWHIADKSYNLYFKTFICKYSNWIKLWLNAQCNVCNHCIKYNTLVMCRKTRVICWNKLIKNAYINIRKNNYYNYDAYQNLLIIVAVVCTPLSAGGGGGVGPPRGKCFWGGWYPSLHWL